MLLVQVCRHADLKSSACASGRGRKRGNRSRTGQSSARGVVAVNVTIPLMLARDVARANVLRRVEHDSSLWTSEPTRRSRHLPMTYGLQIWTAASAMRACTGPAGTLELLPSSPAIRCLSKKNGAARAPSFFRIGGGGRNRTLATHHHTLPPRLGDGASNSPKETCRTFHVREPLAPHAVADVPPQEKSHQEPLRTV